MSSILLTGSEGYVGRALQQRLRQRFEVYTIDRVTNQGGNSHIQLDLSDRGSKQEILEKLPKKIDVIVHLAAARTDWGMSPGEYFRDNVEATRVVAGFARQLCVRRFINMSSVAAISPLAKLSFSPCLSFDEAYCVTKFLQEQVVAEELGGQSEIKLLNIRPSAIFSSDQPSNTNTYKFFRMCMRWPVVFCSGNPKSLTYLPNLIEAIDRHLESDEEGDMLAIEKPVISTKELAVLISSTRRVRPFLMEPPGRPMMMAAGVFEWMSAKLGRTPVITRSRVRKYLSNTAFDTAEFAGNVGYEPKTTLEEAIKRTVS